ncbi:MAG TPA: NAD-glutamate dehydrogenase domain-containing protein [Nitriliruptorales bacterium]
MEQASSAPTGPAPPSADPAAGRTITGHEQVDDRVDQLVRAVAALAGSDRPEVYAGFARAALRRVSRSQLEAADDGRIAAQVAAAVRFADARTPGQLAIRVFTPEVSLDGWSDPGTVVEVNVDDHPFLLSTAREEIREQGYALVRTLHPIVGVERDDDGRLLRIVPARQAEHRESFLHLELDHELDPDAAAVLERGLTRVLRDALAATRDYDRMRERLLEVAAGVEANAGSGFGAGDVAETAAFLRWLLDDNFLLLGFRDYQIHPEDRTVVAVPDSGLGILRDTATSRYADPVGLDEMDDELVARFLYGPLLMFSRTNRLSTVHRRSRMDYVGVKQVEDGKVVGEHRLLGLFTSKGYAEPSASTPVLRRKLEHILEREDVVAGSHDETVLVGLFQALPKDELLQTDLDTLHQQLLELIEAEERRSTKVMIRVDRFTRSASVILALPRDRYSPALREQLQDLFLQRFAGERVEVDLSLGDRAEALARFSIHGVGVDLEPAELEELRREVRGLTRSWADEVRDTLISELGEADAHRLHDELVRRLPVAYRDDTDPHDTLQDLLALDRLRTADLPLHVRVQHGDRGLTRFRAYHRDGGLELSGFLPILESLGLTVIEERPYRLEGTELVVHDFGVRYDQGSLDDEEDGARLAEATLAAWRGHFEVDSLNRLVLRAGLSWPEVQVLRAYRRFRRQVGTAYTADTINDALVEHPSVASGLAELFAARFDPHRNQDEQAVARSHAEVEAACDAVERLDQDRILRGFLALVDATLRTNFYVPHRYTTGAAGVPYLSLKFDSGQVPDAPRPVPYREIFVFSPAIEGVHLRGGPVARGGLRWSDRQDDVRTEVLGLMKAQMLKNAVIVPTGAKGGFVLKRTPGHRTELAETVREQYVTYIRALLDITDNVVHGQVVPPDHVRCRDGDDPYLVVAADKGTATFSDTANAVAAEYGFWLGDAFASGGSHGYDHKALGITAKGAWVAVRRHFHELDIDVQHDAVKVVGIGDMSGDVFGNGMLLSRSLALVAAFDHRHVFLDPDPDSERSWQERQRLSELPRSSWQDYDADLISPGGGVFSRARKSIPLSTEVRELLRVDAGELPPSELIQAILRAPVDLLWAGGIGTYVKASTESNAEIGDRANDELRVDATDLRARVIGEGANLAVTQDARIQYARRGGRINLDAVDNAAGVNISDHEVNVKILLRLAEEAGAIDRSARDELLGQVTNDIVELVLRDQELQTWRLSQEAAESPERMDAYEALMARLEEAGDLDRAVERLPTTEEIGERAEAGAGLTRPELAVLMQYAKRELAVVVVGCDLPDLDVTRPVLRGYFPDALVERFDDHLDRHRLRRELVGTVVANDLVNRLGITFASRLAAEVGRPQVDVVRAYWAARSVAGADRRWREIERLGFLLGAVRQLEVKRAEDNLVESLTRTYLGADALDLARLIDRDRPVFATLERELFHLGTDDQRRARVERAQRLVDDLVQDELAAYLAGVDELAIAPDVAGVVASLSRDRPVPAIGDGFLRLGDRLGIDRVDRLLGDIVPADRWQRWERGGLRADLRVIRRKAATAAFREEPDLPEPDAVARYLDRRREGVEHARSLIRDASAAGSLQLNALSVAVRALREALRD